jgi:type IV pilus assembly protein PilC
VVGLTGYVLPRIADLYHELRQPVPFPASGLLAAREFLVTQPFLILGVLVVLVVIGFWILRTRRGRYAVDVVVLRLPILGPLLTDYVLACLFQSLGILIGSGLSMLHAMDIAARTVGNRVYQQALTSARPILLHGAPFTEALRPFPNLFPLHAQSILEVGQNTGKFVTTLEQLATYYERVVSHKSQMITTLIEPILMVVVGVVLGGLALAVFLPIYQISNVI